MESLSSKTLGAEVSSGTRLLVHAYLLQNKKEIGGKLAVKIILKDACEYDCVYAIHRTCLQSSIMEANADANVASANKIRACIAKTVWISQKDFFVTVSRNRRR